MLKSVLPKIKKPLLFILSGMILLLHTGFKPAADEQQMLAWLNKCFQDEYDPSGEPKLKNWQFTLTDDSFIRLRKTYHGGKQEYYSFHLPRFSDMNYNGTDHGGMLELKTIADDVIVQTYNDPKGDIDSMSTQLDVPVKVMEPGRLDSLRQVLNYFKSKTL